MLLQTIKLDWLAIKYYWWRIFFVPLAICLCGFFHPASIILAISIQMLVFSYFLFAIEEKGKLESLYMTLPISRKTFVAARYSLMLILQIGGMAFATGMTYLMSALLYGRQFIFTFTHDFMPGFFEMSMYFGFCLLFCALMNLSMYPVLFKLGYAKGKAWGYYIPMGVLVVLGFITGVIMGYDEEIILNAIEALGPLARSGWLTVIFFALAILIYGLSFAISQKVYAKREL
jgi:hypothetical protein